MRTIRLLSLIALIGSLMLSSCVSSKKYKDMLADKDAQKSSYDKKLADLNAQMKSLEEKNSSMSAKYNELENNFKLTEKQKLEFQNLSEERAKELAKIKNELKMAFSSIIDSDLQITEKFDKLYVSLPNRVLYDKGSDKISKTGLDVVKKLGEVFKKNPKMDVVVEGHTDDDPVVRTKHLFKDNWGLSTSRSVNVVRELIKIGVPSKQMSASGRADAVTSGEIMQGRDPKAYDRRIEFIITPDVHKLYSIAEAIK
jgi:chemotaxis protein MotB